MFYEGKRVLVTGGAGFIGSALINQLIKKGAITTIGDNLSSGSLQNIQRVWKENDLKWRKTKTGLSANKGHRFVNANYEHFSVAIETIKDHDIVFHLAANFGGRGYIDTHPADCSEGFAINQNVIKASSACGIDRVFFASSACVYPHDLQKEYDSTYLLKETDAIKNNWANADQEYGWAKLMGEMTLKAYNKQYGLKGSGARYVTAYGPWENDTHAIIMLIRRAVERQDPYIVWGSGNQDRDFTYVDDIASGTLAACEKITNGDVINLGTSTRYTIKEVVEMIFDIINWHPKKIIFDKTKPEGVKTRALNNTKAKKILRWQPQYDLRRGLESTIEWFISEKPLQVETL
ncbi:MAG TPA: NAD-dependent epimerase/dehydratase family protein [Candidatus Limnocylindrales bacterium]|nr:NAD-dependent epimerase/dehydratase family protein [Candidatus Limnocylindrales bacterium]